MTPPIPDSTVARIEPWSLWMYSPKQQEVVAWLKARGFVQTYCNWGISWSHRSGYDSTELEFYPLQRSADDAGWDAIIGCHASGTNLRMIMGTCETFDDVRDAVNLVRRLNGYPHTE